MIASHLLCLVCLTSASAERPSITDSLNELIIKGQTTIEETILNVRPNGLRLPFHSLNWPSAPKGDEEYTEHPGQGYGLTLSGKKGSEVLAPSTGIVKYVGPMGNHSSVIIVDHRQQVQTIFIGLDKKSVKAGQNVYSGQRLARLPAYGSPTHKYFFELRYKGKSIDPLPYLKQRG